MRGDISEYRERWIQEEKIDAIIMIFKLGE
jgi:hypothetical protein